jgi:suppressor for copper-sensitivity B
MEARATPSAAPAGDAWALLASTIALAWLGGLILNLMPCVLPVLSLKLLGVVGHGGGERGAIRRGFLASAAGVVFSVMLLAAGTIAVKSAGHAVGWGIQFQEPAFLTALALLCVFFAANLWGLYEIRLPGFLSDSLAGRGAHSGQSLIGSFLTGAFATVLATPCSAPFLGTALGFALSRGPGEILAIFAALGLGLATPYLLVAAYPSLARLLPRPGRWMIALKAVLGALLAGTALWLVTVAADALGWRAALAVGAALAAIPLVFLARRWWPDHTRRSGIAALLALVILAFALPAKLPPGSAARAPAQGGDWRPFARAEIPGLVAQGRVVFVDVTADWCITCKANKALVLDRPPVADLLARPNVVRMLADWTRPSDEIASYLASFGRYGIPFNVVYGPGAPGGLALPELLTGEAVADALSRAAAVKQSAKE